MPNWTNNTLIIEKATDEQIKRIITAAKADRLLEEFYAEPDWRQIPNEDGHLPGPPRARWIKGTIGPARNWVDGSRFPNGQYDQRWYGWRTDDAHWGTKWEVQDPFVEVEDGLVTLTFETAWCPPSAAWFEKLSEAMPNTQISHFFDEPGMDFYGVTYATNGDAVRKTEELEPIREEFLESTCDAEQLTIYRNEDHKDHDIAYENAMEMWCDEGREVIEEAQGRLLEDVASMIDDLKSTTISV